MENDSDETRNTEAGPADKVFLRNLIIAKVVVLLVVLAVVGLMLLAL